MPKKGSSSVPIESGSAVTGPVTEDEIRAVLTQEKPVTTQDLVAKFKSRLKCKEVCYYILVINLLEPSQCYY